MSSVVLEPEAQEFVKATANPPFLFDLGPEKGRKAVDEVQSSPIAKPEVNFEDRTVAGGPSGSVSVRIVRPPNVSGTLPVIVYVHGAGWVFGNAHTHDRLTGTSGYFRLYRPTPKPLREPLCLPAPV